LFIKPSGNIHLCGCSDSPKIGNVVSGIEAFWLDMLNTKEYRESDCIKGLRKNKEYKKYKESLKQKERYIGRESV
jgi:hypothetical protein